MFKGTCARKHIRHIRHLTNIPTTNVLIKDGCGMKHIRHIRHLTNVPVTNVLVSFTVDDIGITNGTINSGSFTKVSETPMG
jgi:hypothetical protein